MYKKPIIIPAMRKNYFLISTVKGKFKILRFVKNEEFANFLFGVR